MLNKKASVYGSREEDMFSAGILLTAPIAKLKTVTARDIDIILFSKLSFIGFIQENTIPYIPAMTNVKPM